jgi:hypothetical protein
VHNVVISLGVCWKRSVLSSLARFCAVKLTCWSWRFMLMDWGVILFTLKNLLNGGVVDPSKSQHSSQLKDQIRARNQLVKFITFSRHQAGTSTVQPLNRACKSLK